MSNFFHKSVLFSLLISLVVFVGCGGPSYVKTEYVTGTITWKGAPLAEAVVSFSPVNPDGIPASGITNEQGKYELFAVGGKPGAGAIAGDYVVTVTKKETKETRTPDPNSSSGERVTGVTTLLTPQKYEKDATTPLKATIAPGKNPPIDFQLED